jgi:hypothetical protein
MPWLFRDQLQDEEPKVAVVEHAPTAVAATHPVATTKVPAAPIAAGMTPVAATIVPMSVHILSSR